MKVSYNKLFTKLKENELRQKDFKEQANINSNTLNKLLHGQSVTTEIICRICDYFNCMPDEIMEWIPDAEYEKANEQIASIDAQIAELMAKKKQLQQK